MAIEKIKKVEYLSYCVEMFKHFHTNVHTVLLFLMSDSRSQLKQLNYLQQTTKGSAILHWN